MGNNCLKLFRKRHNRVTSANPEIKIHSPSRTPTPNNTSLASNLGEVDEDDVQVYCPMNDSEANISGVQYFLHELDDRAFQARNSSFGINTTTDRFVLPQSSKSDFSNVSLEEFLSPYAYQMHLETLTNWRNERAGNTTELPAYASIL